MNAVTGGLRGISYGGGVQSTAMIVLAAQHRLDDIMGGPVVDAVFANTGDDSEDPRTLRYIRDVIGPWAADHGITVHEVARTYADGRPYQTLHQYLVDPNRRGYPIPVRMKSGAPARRICTSSWKVEPVERWWIHNRGASADNVVAQAIGISTDEYQRATTKQGHPAFRRLYPLIDMRLSRDQCAQIIADAGIPTPPVKSACWFCPWKSRNTWRDMKRETPELFGQAVELERIMHDKAIRNGHGPVFLTDDMVPLDRAVGDGVQGSLLDGPDECGGSCWT